MQKDFKAQFVSQLLEWHNDQNRQLPWKENKDAYSIWLSEIILQQTRVAQGLPYYLRFKQKFPSVYDLASAEESEIFKAWEGLGYYSRARNLHHTSKAIVHQFGGKFPDQYEDLIKLKGIGPYTAAAIASFAFDKPHAVLDGNVFRVLSRLFGIQTPIDLPEGKQSFSTLANELLPHELSARYNQAIMDFGALQCVPQKPDCSVCPFSDACIAFNMNMTDLLPVKSKRIIKKDRYFHFFEIYEEDELWLHKRSQKDIWQDLYQFPLIESSLPLLLPNEMADFIRDGLTLVPLYASKQQLTHITVHATFYKLSHKEIKIISDQWLKIKRKDLGLYPFPKIMHAYFQAIEKWPI